MLRIVIINLIVFVLFILLFIFSGFAIGMAMGTANHSKETAEAYVVFWLLHLYINYRMLKKRSMDSIRHKTIAAILITGAYIGYLFIFK